MKKIISTVFYLSLLVLVLPLTGQAESSIANEAIEVTSIRIDLNNSLEGYAIVKRCPTCEDVKLKIDGSTQVSNQGKSIPLHTVNHMRANSATVVYDPKTKQVQRIIW